MKTRIALASALLSLCSIPSVLAEEPAPFTPAPIRAEHVSPELAAQIAAPRYFTAESPADRFEKSRRRWKRAWIASWAAYAVVNVLDAHSSQGLGEANPLLRGANGGISNTKALAVKGALGAGFLFWQQRTIRKNPDKNLYKAFTFATAGAAGAMGGVAAHNYSLK